MDLKKPTKLSKRIQDTVSDAIKSSTGHGCPNILKSKIISIKIMWSFFTALSMGICTYLIIESILSYFKYEVTTKTRVVNEYMSIFPTITVCNLNYFTSNDSVKFIKDLQMVMNSQDINPIEHLFVTVAKMYSKQKDYEFLKEKYGDSLNKLIVNCQFNYERCELDEFKFFLHPNYGNCYQFNLGQDLNGKRKELKSVGTTERQSGLRLILNISVTDELKFMSSSLGALLFVHNHTTNPMLVDSIALKPKTETNIAVSRTFYQSERKPFSNCDGETDDINSHNSEYYKIVHENSKTYTQALCFHQCIQKYFIDNCGCFVAEYLCFYHSKPCDLISWKNCIGEAFQNIKNGYHLKNECEKKCPLECQGMWFDKTVSANEYSNLIFEKALTQYNGSDAIYFNRSFDSSEIAVVNIYYQNLGFLSISENPTTSLGGLLSNIGGIASLFLGISFLTLVEILEFFMNVIHVIKDRKIKVIT